MKEEVSSKLCYYDIRNPDNILGLFDEDEKKEISKLKSCTCDNCFYGRTILAQEILKLKDELHRIL